MKKPIYFFASFLIMIFLMSSCGNERTEIEVTFVFDKPLDKNNASKYPECFKELAIPFNTSCSELSMDFLPKPINISRLDISKKEVKTNAWHFENIGENTVDFSTNWLNKYFQDSIPPAYLFEALGDKNSLESFVEKNKDNTFIYSEESERDEFQELKVYSSTKSLLESIKNNACKNSSKKIYILINPTLGIAPMIVEEPTVKAPIQPIVASPEVVTIFNKIGEKDVSTEERFNMINDHLEPFSDDAHVKEFGKNGTLVGLTPIREYFEKIAFYLTLERIEIMAALQNSDEKYWEVRVVEHHLNDPK